MPKTRLAVAGLDHGHVNWILRHLERDDVEYVGFYDASSELTAKTTDAYELNPDIVFNDLDTMLDTVKPEGVVAFSSIYAHLDCVQKAAPRGIHVMVEKPLAVSMEHATEMKALAEEHDIYLLTNYATTWYNSNQKVYDIVQSGQIGDIRKIVVHDGHKGPAEIGCSPEFLAWLTDPVLNGGGAIIDFGCYGANLATWLSGNQRPTSVFAIAQTLKPDVYPKVDDDAVIVISYPTMNVVVQGSWNWAIARKDMEVYGATGYAHALDPITVQYQTVDDDEATTLGLDPRPNPHDDPMAYFGAVLRGEIVSGDDDLYGLPNNMLVVEILDAARESVRMGQRVEL